MKSPVVVELFTSQGCSSCPPADALLSEWGLAEAKAGRLLPLAFHVDYWDELGWPDPFASQDWTLRQRRYAGKLGGGTYTPELVVAGREGLVGSDAGGARKAVGRAASAPSRLSLVIQEGRLLVHGSKGSGTGGRLVLVTYENGLYTRVTRGENRGETLRNDYVVRSLKDLGEWDGKTGLEKSLAPDLSGVKDAAKAGAVVFLQDPATLAVSDAAGAFPLRAPSPPSRR